MSDHELVDFAANRLRDLYNIVKTVMPTDMVKKIIQG